VRYVGLVLVVALVASGCNVLIHRTPPPGPDGFVAWPWARARQNDFLRFATASTSPSSVTNAIAHAEAATRFRDRPFDASVFTPESFASSFEKIDTFTDTADFDLLYLMNLWFGYRNRITPALRSAIESRMVAFKYWYTDPQPAGVVDQRYYWSENHRHLYHVEEYLAGQSFPTTTFTNDGRTGAQHRERARGLIDGWLTEKARFGFTEWHSDVYYQKTAIALLTLVEWSGDAALAERASGILDLLLFDIALHLQQGNFGATHGRSYMKDKSVATDQDVFGLAKLLFDDTRLPYQSNGDAGATLFARAKRYRLPAVLARVAHSNDTSVDRERMGVPLDATAPISPNPQAPYGYAFDDPANVPFWWEKGTLTAWQNIPMTLDQLDRYGLWESDFFKPFKPLADLAGGDPAVAQGLARQLEPMIGFAFLTEVSSYTYRSPDVMLSTAQDYRAGKFGDQHHISQATLDERAIVFTTHPKNEPIPNTAWIDDDGYWTGSGSLPRAVQHGATSVSLYAPGFASPGPPLQQFGYLPYTHAYFPTEHFDEVVQQGGWTFGRKDGGYVALYSWRPTQWRTYTDPAIFTHGLTRPFDLVAPGGADNVWVTQVGSWRQFHSFAAFRAAVLAHPVEVAPRPPAGGLAGGFDVAYDSPTEGRLTFGTTGPLTVKGADAPVAVAERYDNPWSHTPFDAPVVRIADRRGSITLDLTTGRRRVR
jgi:hypothetical protein